MSDKSDTPRTDAAEYEVPLQDDLFSDEGLRQVVPSHVARQLERELAEVRAERNAAIARSMSNAMEAQAHEDRARMAEAECKRLRDELHATGLELVNSVYGQPCPTPAQWDQIQATIAGALRKP
jgi:hypothetical protein